MSGFEVATVGDNCIDKFLPPVGLAAIGGNAVNVAVHLRKQGLATAYFGAVGPDEDGRRMLECFRENGLVVDHVQIREGVTAYTDLDVDATGDRIITFEEFGVCRGYRPSEEDVARLLTMRHVHIGWFDDGGALKNRLLAAGVRRVRAGCGTNPCRPASGRRCHTGGSDTWRTRQYRHGWQGVRRDRDRSCRGIRYNGGRRHVYRGFYRRPFGWQVLADKPRSGT